MARVGCRIFLTVHKILNRRSLTTACYTPWKNAFLPLSFSCNVKSIVAVEAVAEVKSGNLNQPYDLRTLCSPKLSGKMVPAIKNIENHKINEVTPERFSIYCPKELLIPTVDVEVPPFKQPLEKKAARLIVIRRRKMKKHKLKKLRKRMKFEWAKIRQKREMRKEKAFQAVLIEQIKAAEKFSAEEFVATKLKLAYEPVISKSSSNALKFQK